MIVAKEEAFLTEKINIPVRDECDVVIAGGGAAGVTAAIAASANGARVILVEQNTFLGGSLLGEDGTWKGFYNHFKPYGTDPVQLVRGIPDLFIKRLTERQGSTGSYEETAEGSEESRRIHGDREEMPQLFLELMKEYGIILYLSSVVADVIKEGNTIRGIIMAGKYGREAILAKTVIDTTGNADVTYQAGAGCRNSTDRQRAGIAFGLGNIDFFEAAAFASERKLLTSLCYADKGGGHRDRVTRLGIKAGMLEEFKPCLSDYCLGTEICITSNREGRGMQIGGISMKLKSTGAEELSRAYAGLNHCCFKVAALLKEVMPGFENSFVDWTSPYLSVDFGRIVECRYDIKREDINNNKIPEDTIGVLSAASPGCNTGGKWYGIPYRALLPENIDNLIVAGRMISSEDEVWQSTRTAGSCFLQGQAAGTAAALAAEADGKVSGINIGILRERLLKSGAFLG